MGSFDNIELARGYFEEIMEVQSVLLVQGWMLLPDREFSSFRIYLNGKLAGSAEVVLREDVAHAFPWIPHAIHSGFRLQLQGAAVETIRAGWLDVVGCHQDGRPIARLDSRFRTDLDTAVPAPPPELMQRVAHTQHPHFFKIGGLKSFGEFADALNRHCEFRSVRRLLDWGCGCGRVTMHFLLEPDRPEIYGCDIDPEAIAWCSEHLQPGNFSRAEPWPPTPYQDASFDIVIAHSVFTHRSEKAQRAWLVEMRRIIAPGGLFLASTLGEFADLFTFPRPFGGSDPPRGLAQKLKSVRARYWRGTETRRKGIFDGTLDPALKGIAPEGYYRSVFQTREYTLREWSKYFTILEYRERGMGNFQDLVVMQRPV